MGHRLTQIELANSARHNELMVLLQRTLDGQTHVTCNIDHNHLVPNGQTQAYTGNVQSIVRTVGDSNSHAFFLPPASGLSSAGAQSSVAAERSQLVPLNQSAVRALRGYGRKPRLAPCPCSCHTTLRYSTCPIRSKVFGNLVIGVSGRVFIDSACDTSHCLDHPHFSMTVAYYFPSWLLAKAIIFQCVRSPYGQPSFGLQVRNLLPEHSQAMRAIERGQPLVLPSMLEDRVSTPNDMEEMGWTLLTV